MNNKRNGIKTNASGYSDPTAYNAIIEADKLDQEIINNILEDIFKVCKENGVFIYGDIAFVYRKTRRKVRGHLYYNEFLDWENDKKSK